MMKRFCAIGIILFLCSPASMAWVRTDIVPYPNHYVDVHAAAGIGGLGYEIIGGKTQMAPAFSLGAGYTWFFLPSAGFQTGFLITRIATTASLTESMEWSYDREGNRLTDYMGEEYTHRTSFNNWYEKQQLLLLQIPVGLRFRHFASQNGVFGFHSAAGALLTIPLAAPYTHTSGQVTHTGWYDQWKLLLHDVPGKFETEPFNRQVGSFTSHLRSFSLAIYAEAGVLLHLGERMELAVAAYIHWMPTDMIKVPQTQREDLGFANANNGYTFMNEYNGLIGTSRVGALRPWNGGVKVSLSLWPGQTNNHSRRCLCIGVR